MERTYIKDLNNMVGKEVTIKGWVDVRRDQGKMVFMDMMVSKINHVVWSDVHPNYLQEF